MNDKFWSGQGKSIFDDVLTILSWLKIVAQPAQTEYNSSQQIKKQHTASPCQETLLTSPMYWLL